MRDILAEIIEKKRAVVEEAKRTIPSIKLRLN